MMSKSTPKRPVPPSAKKPTADFNWPPTEEELKQSSAATVQRLNKYLDRRSGLEPPPNTETLQSEAPKPRTDFNWPPSEEELAECGIETGEHEDAFAAGVETAVPVPTAQRPIPAIAHEASWIPADPGQAIARDDEAVMGAVSMSSEANEPDYVGDSISVSAVVENEAAFDGTGTGNWPADIARLQAVIDGLTEKVEWRITSVTGY